MTTVCMQLQDLSVVFTACRPAAGEHPAGGDGLWGTGEEVPSFLYAMQLPDGRVFLEETCLVAKPALPFATLKRRLYRRLQAMGITVGLTAAHTGLADLMGRTGHDESLGMWLGAA